MGHLTPCLWWKKDRVTISGLVGRSNRAAELHAATHGQSFKTRMLSDEFEEIAR